MAQSSRVKKSIKNISYSLLGYVCLTMLQLVNRLIFVQFLPIEYLGIHGLFTNIITILSLSELGVGTAIVYALYKPVAENRIEKIKSLMALYKKIYTIIGFSVMALGVLLTPFLHLLIRDKPDIKYLRVYFLLYVLNAGISYFYTYKRSLIICNQDEYISSLTMMFTSIGNRLCQIIVLYLTKSFLLYLIVQIIFTRLENVIIARIADQKYPYLKDKDCKPLEKEETDGIKKNVMAMMIHNVGNVVVNATDNVIVSKILGLASVGILSNYTMVFDLVSGAIMKIFTSIAPSLGNLVALEKKEKTEGTLYQILFLNFWIVSSCTICLYCLCQPFIELWLGKSYLLSQSMVAVLSACFYITGMRRTVLHFRNAAGLFWQDRYKAIAESLVNLTVSIPLTLSMGLIGVKIGTLISMAGIAFWMEPYVLFKYYFKKSAGRYMTVQILYGVVTIISAYVLNRICMMIPAVTIGSFIIKIAICVIPINVIILLVYWFTQRKRPQI